MNNENLILNMNSKKLDLINKIVNFWVEYDSSLNKDNLVSFVSESVINNDLHNEIKYLFDELGVANFGTIEEKEIIDLLIYILNYMLNNDFKNRKD